MEVGTFTKLRVKKFPRKILANTPENNFWNKFQNLYEKNYSGAITNMICGNKKRNFGLSYGNVIELYQTKKEAIQYSISKFKSEVTCLRFREDGKLMAVGENDGKIQVIETKKKDFLRTFKNHKKAVFCACFSNIDPILVSGSDDLAIKIFDIPTNSLTRSYQNFHKDYIRGLVSLNSKNFISSSYDQTAHLFDISIASNKAELSFNHNQPIEAIDYAANKLVFASVGGLECKIWDLRNNKEPISTLSSNKKTLTCVRFVSSGERFFTSSLDQLLKIYSTEDFQLTHQYKYPSPINSFDITPENTHLAVGMAEGTVIIKKKNTTINLEDNEDKEEEFKMPAFFSDQKKRIRNYSYFYRGIYKTPQDFDLKLHQRKNPKLSHIETFLKKFQYKQALLSALNSKKNEVIVSLIEELLQRGVLNLIFRKMNSSEKKILMEFIEKHINVGKFQETLVETLDRFLDEMKGREEEVLEDIEDILEEEIEIENEIEEICGGLESIRNCQGF